ncbi:MAG: hypothetical protein ACHQ50_14185 [Fimbriimonadales bacterium]
MHQVHLSDSAYSLISLQAKMMGVSVEEVIERYFAAPKHPAISIGECMKAGRRRKAFASKDEVSAHIRSLRDEWDR